MPLIKTEKTIKLVDIEGAYFPFLVSAHVEDKKVDCVYLNAEGRSSRLMFNSRRELLAAIEALTDVATALAEYGDW